ncbi:MAG: sulfatase-like hydrolase/transferase [Chitinophagaceae bacterium]|nr:sulfatase-like hydrolase/transferase [Chitinophagaceae bacterium]
MFYKNAFCYSHESNKGITAILAGIPTLTDIPFYHSQYVNMPVTAIGRALQKDNYSSIFCIGDAYDNFGFAKCMNWLGIDKYYSEEDIPGYKELPAHSMGLQDENVLPFFYQKLNAMQKPFLGIHYNISTHYPYDLSPAYKEKFPGSYTPPMKSMQYYDHCLRQFFNEAAKQPWFKETVFIFCSDHWMFPEGIEGTYNAVSSYRIPLIIFDPATNKKEIRNEVVSQFDVLGTMMAATGYKDSITSYGGNLFDSSSLNSFAFSKPGSSLYQVTDSNYVLGFNVTKNQAEYLYNYKKDNQLKENLVANKNASSILDALTKEIKSFIQKAGAHYNGKPVR